MTPAGRWQGNWSASLSWGCTAPSRDGSVRHSRRRGLPSSRARHQIDVHNGAEHRPRFWRQHGEPRTTRERGAPGAEVLAPPEGSVCGPRGPWAAFRTRMEISASRASASKSPRIPVTCRPWQTALGTLQPAGQGQKPRRRVIARDRLAAAHAEALAEFGKPVSWTGANAGAEHSARRASPTSVWAHSAEKAWQVPTA